MDNNVTMNISEILTAEEVAAICKTKIGKAYQIIRQLNEELEQQGYITLRGRISKNYLIERLGIKKEEKKKCQ